MEMSAGLIGMLVAGGLFVALLFAASLRNARTLAAVCGILLVIGSLGVHTTWAGSIYRTWLLPLQARRTEAFLVIAGLLFVLSIANISKVPRRVLPMQAWLVMLIGVYMGLLRFIHSDPLDAVMTIVATLITVPAVVYGFRTSILDDVTATRAVRVIALAGMVWIGFSAVQFLLNSSLVVTKNPVRFIGMTSNPQAAAILLGPVGMTALWLGLNDRASLRPLWYILTGVTVIMLIWTGSRTGLLMMFTGVAFVAYPRFGGMVFALPLLGLVVWGMLNAASAMGIELPFDRFLSGGNTRADAWRMLWRTGTSNPLIGAGQGEDLNTENSVLLAFAAYGIVMVGLVLLMILSCFWVSFKLFFGRSSLLKEYRPFVDIVVGYNACYVVGSMFEGFIISRVSTHFVMMLMISALASSMMHWKHTGAITGDEQSPPAEDWEYGDPIEQVQSLA